MAIDTNGNLWIYCLNVGQGDTTVVVTPNNQVMIFDAVYPKKIIALLSALGINPGTELHHLLISHPHRDHYSGAERLLNTYDFEGVTLTSIWKFTKNLPGYNLVINTSDAKDIPVTFLSGYAQLYPDNSPIRDPRTLQVELLGPPNQLINTLEQANQLSTNHRSIITRLNWGTFRMIIAADAQMENWAYFDQEQLLNTNCTVLRTSHHGSANGTQYERLTRLNPGVAIVSSDPEGKDHLPDLIGSATMMRYAKISRKPLVALTHKTGTLKIEVRPTGSYKVFAYFEHKKENVDLTKEKRITKSAHPTDWDAILQTRLD